MGAERVAGSLEGRSRAPSLPVTACFQALSQVSRPLLITAAVVSCVGVAALEEATGNGAVMYLSLLPVLVMTFAYGAPAGFATIGVTAATQLVVDALSPRAITGATLMGVVLNVAVTAVAVEVLDENHRLEERQRFLATHDQLTGLLNRRAFMDRAEEERQRTLRYGGSLVVLYIDLNRLKEVNDAAGHAAGDEAIATFAGHLQGAVRTTDVVARIGGDEFCVLLPEASATQGAVLAARLARPDPAGLPSCSIGVVEFIHPAPEIDAVLAVADRTMYRAKATERGICEEVVRSSHAA